MTPKEKAKELVDKFTAHAYHQDSITQCNDHAKQCALIAVDEILNTQWQFSILSMYGTPFNCYWQQVKAEIEAL
jgi:hypothetical protein